MRRPTERAHHGISTWTWQSTSIAAATCTCAYVCMYVCVSMYVCCLLTCLCPRESLIPRMLCGVSHAHDGDDDDTEDEEDEQGLEHEDGDRGVPRPVVCSSTYKYEIQTQTRLKTTPHGECSMCCAAVAASLCPMCVVLLPLRLVTRTIRCPPRRAQLSFDRQPHNSPCCQCPCDDMVQHMFAPEISIGEP